MVFSAINDAAGQIKFAQGVCQAIFKAISKHLLIEWGKKMHNSFDQVWRDILRIAGSLNSIQTLVHKNSNMIVAVLDSKLVIESVATGNQRKAGPY